MLGARVGCYEICTQKMDLSLISDYEWIYGRWNLIDKNKIKKELNFYGNILRQMFDMQIITLSEKESAFAKMILHNPVREGLMLHELGSEVYLKKKGWWKN